MTRYDVIYGPNGDVRIEPHFCREWDENGGCYGTNPSHGFTWEEAREEVARWHERQASFWRSQLEPLYDAAVNSPISRLREWLRDNAPDCGDNSCLFGGRGKGGVRTNGGCRCFKDLPTAKRIYVERLYEAFTQSESGLRPEDQFSMGDPHPCDMTAEERERAFTPSHVAPRSFDQVRDAIVTRMGGHTISEQDGPAWQAFIALLGQVKESECFADAFFAQSASGQSGDRPLQAQALNAAIALIRECVEGTVEDCTKWNRRARAFLATYATDSGNRA